jgi:hypothetical protein
VVNAWSSVEASELFWLRRNQKQIRADLYQEVCTAANAAQVGNHDNGPTDLSQHGTQIVLSSFYSGSSCHMYQLFQDSMAICRYCHKPDLFLTMIANSNWPEVQDALLNYEGIDDDPDQPRKW